MFVFWVWPFKTPSVNSKVSAPSAPHLSSLHYPLPSPTYLATLRKKLCFRFPCACVFLSLFVSFFFRWILSVCMANFKTMTNFVANGNMKGSLVIVATNKNPRFSSLTFSFPFSSEMQTHPKPVSFFCLLIVLLEFSLTPKCDHRKIQAVLVILFFSFRQAYDPLTFKTLFSLNPS